MQKALCDFYAVVVRCCEQAIIVTRRSGYMQLIKAVTGSFESDFGHLLTQVRNSSEEVNEAIRLAEAKLGHRERQLQDSERGAAERYRLGGIMHRQQWAKAEAERLEHMQLERCRIQQASMLAELSSFDHKTALRRAQIQRHGSTGQWLVHTQQFTAWVAGNKHQTLWCTGKLGSGKTILTAYAVEHLSAQCSQTTAKVVYFFCQYNNEMSLQATTILRSIIRQLLDQDAILFKMNELSVKVLLEHNPLNMARLEALLLSVISNIGNTVVIIDGLDECSAKQMKLILRTLRNIQLHSPSRLKLYLAGDDRVTGLVKDYIQLDYTIQTQSAEASSDMEELIRQLVLTKQENGDLKVGNIHLYEQIVETLSKGAQGMILWVKLQLEEVCLQKTDESIKETLTQLPKDLFETYNRLLSRIVGEGSKDLCIKVFRWTAAVKRPLTLEELREAIAVQPTQSCFQPERMVNDIKAIPRWCHGLVTLDELDGVVQFTHSSIKDFLCSTNNQRSILQGFNFTLMDADQELGDTCVTYLNFNYFRTQLTNGHKSPGMIDPMSITYQALKQSPGVVSSLARRVLADGNRPASVSTALVSSHGNSEQIGRTAVPPEYFLRAYASTYWLHHSRSFHQDRPAMWRLWKRLVSEEFEIDGTAKDGSLVMSRSCLAGLSLINFTITYQHYAMILQLCRPQIVWTRSDLDMALLLALQHNCIPFVEPLLESKAYPNRSNWLLDALLESENLELIESLILSSHEWIHDLETVALSACLECMIIYGSLQAVSACIQAGANAMELSPFDWLADTPPGVSKPGATGSKMSKLASKSPGDLTQSPDTARTRLSTMELAIRLCRADIVKLLCAQDLRIQTKPQVFFGCAVSFSNADTLKVLLDTGTLVDYASEHGCDLLHLAVQRIGRRVSSTTGLSCGDGYPSKAPLMNYALGISQPWDHVPMIEMLLDAAIKTKIDLNIKDLSGNTPIDYAPSRRTRKEIKDMLAESERKAFFKSDEKFPLPIDFLDSESMQS
ncbi:hypothetical protein D6D17_00616 [Aureobasidium pullulans]|nr:hypothetical protein D6D17_00616 [Aureobasidium pullulans]